MYEKYIRVLKRNQSQDTATVCPENLLQLYLCGNGIFGF